MTYDPDRDTRAPGDVNPNRRPSERNAGGRSMGLLLGLIALLLVGGFLFYGMRGDDTDNVASDGRPAATQTNTTGTGGAIKPTTPAPTTPAPANRAPTTPAPATPAPTTPAPTNQ